MCVYKVRQSNNQCSRPINERISGTCDGKHGSNWIRDIRDKEGKITISTDSEHTKGAIWVWAMASYNVIILSHDSNKPKSLQNIVPSVHYNEIGPLIQIERKKEREREGRYPTEWHMIQGKNGGEMHWLEERRLTLRGIECWSDKRWFRVCRYIN